MSKEKQIEELGEREYDCDRCQHFGVCYKIHQYHVHQIDTGLYCPSFKRKQSEGEWVKDNASKFKHRYNCSVCDYRLVGIPTDCCPNCGAKMKDGAE